MSNAAGRRETWIGVSMRADSRGIGPLNNEHYRCSATVFHMFRQLRNMASPPCSRRVWK